MHSDTASESRRPRRGRGEGSLTQLENGRWMARVTVAPGRRRTIYGDSKADTLRRMRDAVSRSERGEPQSDARITVTTFLTEWLEGTAKLSVRSSTYASYAHYVRFHIIPGLGRHRLTRLTPEQVDAFLAEKSASGLSPRTCQYMRAILRSALAWAVKRGRLSRNVAALSNSPKVERPAIVPLALEDARRMVAAASNHRLGALFVLALDSGARQGELLGLKWADVDLYTSQLRIVRTKYRVNGTNVFGEPKSSSSRRTIQFTATTSRMLKRHRSRQLRERLTAGPRWTEHDLVFATDRGVPLHASTVTHQFQKFLAQNDLPRQRFHDLRHCSATFLLSQGVPIKVIQERLGHSQVSLTLSTYAHLSLELQREAVERMEGVLRGGGRER